MTYGESRRRQQHTLLRCTVIRDRAAVSPTNGLSSPTLSFPAVCHDANEQLPLSPPPPPFGTDLFSSLHPPLHPAPPCSESGLQFVPLPHTSLFKMTLLHFMVNQLFCLTQSAGSASQPARISWGAVGGGSSRRVSNGEGERKGKKDE